MGAGLIVYNDSNTVQLDETYKNLAVTKKATVTGGSGATALNKFWSTTLPAANPVVAVRPTSCFAGVSYMSSSSGSFTIAGHADVDAASVPIFVFDNPPTPTFAPGDIGLAVYDATGAVTFHSDAHYMRVVDFIANVDPQSNTGTTTFTYPSGRDYAVVLCNSGTVALNAPVGLDPSNHIYLRWVVVCQVNGGTITFKDQVVETIGPTTGTTPPTRLSNIPALIIDVTNY